MAWSPAPPPPPPSPPGPHHRRRSPRWRPAPDPRPWSPAPPPPPPSPPGPHHRLVPVIAAVIAVLLFASAAGVAMTRGDSHTKKKTAAPAVPTSTLAPS